MPSSTQFAKHCPYQTATTGHGVDYLDWRHNSGSDNSKAQWSYWILFSTLCFTFALMGSKFHYRFNDRFNCFKCPVSLQHCKPLFLVTNRSCYFQIESNAVNMDMIFNQLAIVLVVLSSSTFAESNTYSLRSNDAILHCVDVASKHAIRYAIDCSLHASRTEIYDNGMVYDGNRCHVCRSNITLCGISTEEVMLRGSHYTKGKLEATQQYTCIMTSLVAYMDNISISCISSQTSSKVHINLSSITDLLLS